jgi:hypothetical protein
LPGLLVARAIVVLALLLAHPLVLLLARLLGLLPRSFVLRGLLGATTVFVGAPLRIVIRDDGYRDSHQGDGDRLRDDMAKPSMHGTASYVLFRYKA